MENSSIEHQKFYFFSYFVPCSLNIVSAMIEQKQFNKGILMLENLKQSLKQKTWDSVEHV